MWSSVVGFVAICGLASVLAAPTVHLVKQEDSEGVPDYQQLLPTDLPPIMDPVWMTVTMKPLVKTTFVEPLNPQYPQPPSEQPSVAQPGVTSYQQPNSPAWPIPTRQNPPATPYYPYYYETQTQAPQTRQFFPAQQPQQYPFNVQPQFQYPYQSYPQLTWKPAVHVQPCANGVQQAYHHQQYQHQRGY